MVLVSLLCLIFAHILPNVRASDLQLVVGIALVVVLNTVVSHWLARRGFGRVFSFLGFMVLVLVNSVVMLMYAALRTRFEEQVSITNVLFFVFLLSLIVALFDRYRQVYLMRFGEGSLYHQRLAKPDAPANL
jgi:hypothetical protein